MEGKFDIEYTVGLKDGRRKFGTMLNKKKIENQIYWKFVPTNNIRSYSKTKDNSLVEFIPDSMISFVDCYSF